MLYDKRTWIIAILLGVIVGILLSGSMSTRNVMGQEIGANKYILYLTGVSDDNGRASILWPDYFKYECQSGISTAYRVLGMTAAMSNSSNTAWSVPSQGIAPSLIGRAFYGWDKDGVTIQIQERRWAKQEVRVLVFYEQRPC